MTTNATKPKRRVPYWDNAKWLAMLLVVVGHAIQPLSTSSDAALVPYLVIYAFHMPFFGVISGYFTAAKPGPKQYGRVIGDLIVPYLIFQTIWSIVHALVRGDGWSLNLVVPAWTLWFLLALAAFRVLLPVIARLRWPLLWTVAVAIAVGFFDDVDQTFSAMRAIQMLPFFVLGWELRRRDAMTRWLETTRTAGVRAAAVATFLVAGAAAAVWPTFWRDQALTHWLFLDRAYGEIADGGAQWWDGGVRLGIMAVTALLIAAALALVPRRRTFFTDWGAATMFIYLLHTFVLFPTREFDLLAGIAGEWWALPAMLVGGALLTVVLSTTPVRAATRWLVEPNVRWLLRPADQATGAIRTVPQRGGDADGGGDAAASAATGGVTDHDARR